MAAMEPRIQYATTADGVSIAFWTLGEGMPLVQMGVPPWGHLEMEWQIPEWRRWYERLAEKRMLVRYDGRGSGLSDRDVAGASLDTQVLDLEAVVDHLALDRFALLGVLHSGPAAISYGAHRPERVSRLLLWCTYARNSDYGGASPQAQALTALDSLIDTDWELYTETVAHARLGWSTGESARQFAAYMREGTTPEAARAAFAAMREYDVSALLPDVRPPTLVLHRRQLSVPDMSIARGLASRIPNARLVLLEGESLAPYLGDTEAVLTAIDAFLGEGEAPTRPAAEPPGTASILFADIVDSAALTERLGDAAFRARARELDTALRGIIREAGGTPVEGKLLGDGVLGIFTSARQAIEAAMRCGKAGNEAGPPPHLGI